MASAVLHNGCLNLWPSSTSSETPRSLSDLVLSLASSSSFTAEASLSLQRHTQDLAQLHRSISQGLVNLSDNKDLFTLLVGGNQVRLSESTSEFLPGAGLVPVAFIPSFLIVRLQVIGQEEAISRFSIFISRGSRISDIKQFIVTSGSAVSRALAPQASQPLAPDGIMLMDEQGRILQDEEVASPSFDYVSDQCYHVSYVCSLALPDDISLRNLTGSKELQSAVSMIRQAGKVMSDSLSDHDEVSEQELDFDLFRWTPFETMISFSRSPVPSKLQTASLDTHLAKLKKMRHDLSECPAKCAVCIEALLKNIDSLDPAMCDHLTKAFEVLSHYVAILASKDKQTFQTQKEHLEQLQDQLQLYASCRLGRPNARLTAEELEECQQDLKGFQQTFNNIERRWQDALAWGPGDEFDRLQEDKAKQIEQLSTILEQYKQTTSLEETKRAELEKHRSEAKLIRDKATSMVDWCLQIEHTAEQGCVDAIDRIDREMERLNAHRIEQKKLLEAIQARGARLTSLRAQAEQSYVQMHDSIEKDISCADNRIVKAKKAVETVTSAIASIPTLASSIEQEVSSLKTYAEELKKCIACDCSEAYAGARKVLTIDKITQEATVERSLNMAVRLEEELMMEETLMDADNSVIRTNIDSTRGRLERVMDSVQRSKNKVEEITREQANLDQEYAPILEYLRSNSQSVTRDTLKVYTTDSDVKAWNGVGRNEPATRVLEMAHVFEERFKEDFQGRAQRIQEDVRNRYQGQGMISM